MGVRGRYEFWLAVLAGTLGGTTGPLTLYALGYYGGRPLLIKYGKYFFIKEEQIQKADDFFEKYIGCSICWTLCARSSNAYFCSVWYGENEHMEI